MFLFIALNSRTMKPFFIETQTNLADKFWSIWGILGQTISTHFGTVSPLSMFSIIPPVFLQKLSLYIHIPNIYLGLGFEFEFGPQRIRDLVPSCVRGLYQRIRPLKWLLGSF